MKLTLSSEGHSNTPELIQVAVTARAWPAFTVLQRELLRLCFPDPDPGRLDRLICVDGDGTDVCEVFSLVVTFMKPARLAGLVERIRAHGFDVVIA